MFLFLFVLQIIYWDDKNIYMEHRFVTPSDHFINAIVLCKTRLTNCSVEKIMSDMLGQYENEDVENQRHEKPQMPLELAKWIECNDISSELLRRDKNSHII